MAEFARDYGIGESQLFNWLKRDNPPLAKHWKKLANFFGVSESYIVSGTPSKVEYSPEAEKVTQTVAEAAANPSPAASMVDPVLLEAMCRTLFDQVMKSAAGNPRRLAAVIAAIQSLQSDADWVSLPSAEMVSAIVRLLSDPRAQKKLPKEEPFASEALSPDHIKALEVIAAEAQEKEEELKRHHERHRRSSKTQEGAG